MQKRQMHRSITERMFGYSRLTWKKLAIVPDAERKPLRERQPKPQRGRNLSQNERRRKNALPLEPNFNSSDLEMYRTRKWPYTHPEKGGLQAVQKKKKREVKHSGELQAARVPYGGRRRLFLRLTTSQFGSNRVDKKFPKDKVCTGAFAEVFCMIFKRDLCRLLEFANTNRQKYGKCAFAIMDGESSK